MIRTQIVFVFLFYLTGCQAQEQIMVEPCARENVVFDSGSVEEWRKLLSEYKKELGYLLIDEGESLTKLIGEPIFYIRLFDSKYLDIDKGGFSISIDNVENSKKLNITVFNSRSEDDKHCIDLANEIKNLLFNK